MVPKASVAVLIGFLICTLDNVSGEKLVGEKKASLEHGEDLSNINCVPVTRMSCGINNTIHGRGHIDDHFTQVPGNYPDERPTYTDSPGVASLKVASQALSGIIADISTSLSLLQRVGITVQNSFTEPGKTSTAQTQIAVYRIGTLGARLVSDVEAISNIQELLQEIIKREDKGYDTKEILDVEFNNGGGGVRDGDGGK